MVAGHTVWLFLPLDRENLSSGYQESCFLTFLTWNIVTGKMTSEIVFILTTKQTNILSFFFFRILEFLLSGLGVALIWKIKLLKKYNFQLFIRYILWTFHIFFNKLMNALFNSKFSFSLNEISEISWLKLNTAMTFVWLIVHYKIMKLDLKEMTHLQLSFAPYLLQKKDNSVVNIWKL